ncbi:MAG: alcohol dehydrogenase catalytic domain-containing protein [Erysipelotrichaceae bacterium]|nr:alcohol dehydrogenase catalytic domain-containing protein [Erysipelotrichaceae bacterium]
MAKMKAALMYGPNDIRVEEIDRPTCKEDGMIINVRAVGLCGSDIRNLTTDSAPGNYPKVYGHEVVGQIVEIGSKVQGYEIGENVFVNPAAFCMKCEYCRNGHSEFCENMPNYLERLGGFADYYEITATQIERGSVYRIPEGEDLCAATLAEPLSSVYSSQDFTDVGFGDTVVVIGAGPIGCFHVQLAKLRGAETVIMIELNETRLEMSKRFPADYFINSAKEDPVEAVLKITNGKGADKVFSANPSTESQNQALYMTRKGGTVIWFGGVAKGSMASIDSNYAHYNGIWMYGHFGFSATQADEAFRLALSDKFQADKFITHIMPLSKINEAIGLTKSGEAIKVVLIPNEELNKDLLPEE